MRAVLGRSVGSSCKHLAALSATPISSTLPGDSAHPRKLVSWPTRRSLQARQVADMNVGWIMKSAYLVKSSRHSRSTMPCGTERSRLRWILYYYRYPYGCNLVAVSSSDYRALPHLPCILSQFDESKRTKDCKTQSEVGSTDAT